MTIQLDAPVVTEALAALDQILIKKTGETRAKRAPVSLLPISIAVQTALDAIAVQIAALQLRDGFGIFDDAITGTGPYTLPGRRKGLLMVFGDGVLQRPADYAIADDSTALSISAGTAGAYARLLVIFAK